MIETPPDQADLSLKNYYKCKYGPHKNMTLIKYQIYALYYNILDDSARSKIEIFLDNVSQFRGGLC